MSKKKPFQGKKVYFSGSIRGSNSLSPKTYSDLINFIKKKGADVLTEFVGASNKDQRANLFFGQAGMSPDEIKKIKNPWVLARKIDFQWVDEADYLIAEVTSPSIGVGMEIQRAKDKGDLGLNHTRILCLCRQEIIDNEKLSWMVKGITPKEHKDFYLVGYKTLLGAKRIMTRFLTNKLKQ